jgi:hypothetical protein
MYIPRPLWYFATKGENLFPLAVGNKWRYNVYIYEGMPMRSPSAARIDSIYIVGDTLIEGKRYFLDQRGYLYRYENDIIEMSFGSYPYNEVTLREFVNLNCDSGGIASIVTELGAFLCQHFRLYIIIAAYPYRQDYNFAPDLGLICFVREIKGPGPDPAKYETWLLIDYEIF